MRAQSVGKEPWVVKKKPRPAGKESRAGGKLPRVVRKEPRRFDPPPHLWQTARGIGERSRTTEKATRT